METFSQKLDEDFASAFRSAGSAIAGWAQQKANRFSQNFRASLGDSAALGALDLSDMTDKIINSFRYFIGQQQLKPTPRAVADFCTTALGMTMTEEQIEEAIFGVKAPGSASNVPEQNGAPNGDDIENLMKIAMDDQQSANDRFTAAEEAVSLAERHSKNESYLVRWVKYIGAHKRNALKDSALAPLRDYAHGGTLTPQQTVQIMTGVAKIILKSQYGATATPNKPGQKPTGKPEAGPVDFSPLDLPTNRNTLAREDEVYMNMTSLNWAKASTTYIYDNAKDAAKLESLSGKIASRLDLETLNSLSAQVMQLVARYPKNDFITLMDNNSAAAAITAKYPIRHLQAAYDFIRAGGEPEEVAAQLNHFITHKDLAADLLIFMIAYVGKQRTRDWNN